MNTSARALAARLAIGMPIVVVATLAGAALYACGETSDSIPEAVVTAGGTSGSPSATPPESLPPHNEPPATAGADATVPAKCDFYDSDAGRDLLPEPQCQPCAAEKCCAAVTRCHRVAEGDAGGLSACALFGACEARCAGDGGLVCEAQCEVTYGSEAAVAWHAAETCLYEPPPTGCGCP